MEDKINLLGNEYTIKVVENKNIYTKLRKEHPMCRCSFIPIEEGRLNENKEN